MKVDEFLAEARTALNTQEQEAVAAAPDDYMAMMARFPINCRRQFLDWLGDGSDIPHDDFPRILARVAGRNEIHDRGGLSPTYAQQLLDGWRESHAHE